MKILLTDDDLELCELLKEYLEQEEFEVSLCHDGESAVSAINHNQFDLLILDIMMPIKNGFETLAEIRRTNNLPVIMLTAKGDKIDRIVGLEMGADDYVAKPCDPRELVARIRAVTRRVSTIIKNNPQTYREQAIQRDDLILDKRSRQVSISNKTIDLTSTEFDFLIILLENAGALVSREKLSQDVLGKKLQTFDRSIDMHMSNLRKKLGLKLDKKERIKTLRGNGYQYLI
jgi:two-component system response regulator CpxR